MSDFFEYMNFFAILIGASFWCFGFHIILKNFLLHALGVDIDKIGVWKGFKKWQQNIMKPLFACPYCMASVHGTAIFFMMLFGIFGLWYWPAFCVCLCGLNYIVNSLLPE